MKCHLRAGIISFFLTPWVCANGPVQAVDAIPSPILLKEYVWGDLPTRSCHASTIAEAEPGVFIVAWFGGTAEGFPDVGIWTSRFDAGEWTTPVEVANGMQPDGTRYPCWNPVLFRKSEAELLLFYKVGPNPEAWWGLRRLSRDGGLTWSEAERLSADGGPAFAEPLGPIKNKPLGLGGGVLLSPSSTEGEHGWRVHFERSDDGGGTWKMIGPVNDGMVIGAIQPSILTLGRNRLLALGRTRQKKVFRITSDDGGLSWGKMTLTDLPNPNAGTDAVTLADGRHMLVYNHSEKNRSPLNIALSDDGDTWNSTATLEAAPGEYSYPAIIQASNGHVHITYTWNRRKIAHAILDAEALSSDGTRSPQAH